MLTRQPRAAQNSSCVASPLAQCSGASLWPLFGRSIPGTTKTAATRAVPGASVPVRALVLARNGPPARLLTVLEVQGTGAELAVEFPGLRNGPEHSLREGRPGQAV